MSNIGSSYSQVIHPADYNRIVSDEHLYISAADQFLIKKIKEFATSSAEVVELGCGPARILPLISEIEEINLTGVDLDEKFLEHAKVVLTNKPHVRIVSGDIETYKHKREVDIFYSHGLHHHVSKGVKTLNYLKNVYNNLNPYGYYILIDEFLPNYVNSKDREIKVVIWYSHIIGNAIKNNYSYLAQEESKIMLDDLFEGRKANNIKSRDQISFVLSKVSAIDQSSTQGNLIITRQLAEEFLEELEAYHNLAIQNDTTLDLSRGDYKICDHIFREEIGKSNFIVDSVKSFGPIESIGAVSVYILRKR